MSLPSPAEYEHLNSLEFSQLFISGGWSKVRSTGHNGAKNGREFGGGDSSATPMAKQLLLWCAERGLTRSDGPLQIKGPYGTGGR